MRRKRRISRFLPPICSYIYKSRVRVRVRARGKAKSGVLISPLTAPKMTQKKLSQPLKLAAKTLFPSNCAKIGENKPIIDNYHSFSDFPTATQPFHLRPLAEKTESSGSKH